MSATKQIYTTKRPNFLLIPVYYPIHAHFLSGFCSHFINTSGSQLGKVYKLIIIKDNVANRQVAHQLFVLW